jgi:sugar/nucleoside kinase (ribokinase family)
LQYLDYLFIAKEDMFMDILELGSKVRGHVIMHHPTGSVFSDGKKVEHYDLPLELYLSDVNVLGAGDYFASGFIKAMCNNKTVKESVIAAHQTASTLIKQNLL